MDEVIVLDLLDATPSSAMYLGKSAFGDQGFGVPCTWDITLEKAKLEARKYGGNVVKITKHIFPDIWYTCHRIHFDILRVENKDELEQIKHQTFQPTLEEIDTTLNYALLYLY